MQRKLWSVLLSLTVLAATTVAFAQTYTVTDLGTLGGNATVAHAINSLGQVTGSSNLTSSVAHAFLYQNGSITDIGSLGGSSALGLGINASGQVTGYSTQANGSYRGFVFSNGVMTAIPPLSGDYSTAYGINDFGQVAGNSVNSRGIPAGFLFSNGTLTDLGNLGGEDGTTASAINNRGQIVGYSYNTNGDFLAFVWQNGHMKSLGTLGGPWSQAYGINSTGQITGTAYLNGTLNGPHAFLFRNGKMTDLDKRSGVVQSWGFGINSAGVVVGKMQVKGGGGFVNFHAFVTVSGKMTDLNQLIPSGSGWILDEAYSINDAGQITGYGELNKKTRGFLLTPVSK
ncbi:MAG: HAF repeat-containing protein [Acidobacteriia bacterium]|nr:HAF repeat-containing protein [Terriglobia bacterium]